MGLIWVAKSSLASKFRGAVVAVAIVALEFAKLRVELVVDEVTTIEIGDASTWVL